MSLISRAMALILCLGTFSLSGQSYSTNITVSLDGSGDFVSIQDAIDAAKAFPDVPITIKIKNGVYHEKVKVHSWNTKLTLIGEDQSSTIITFGDHFDKIDKGRNSTFHTYTLLVDANDFHAENLTVENSAGPMGQAVALHVEGDRCSFVNCSFLGNQDTMYAAGEGSRQFFDKCYIEGTTDFIFGEATVLFRDCEIRSKANSYVTAASTNVTREFGFVFLRCKLTATEGVGEVYLGRPWRKFARTVFIDCELGSHIVPGGWDNWNNMENEKTVFYAEYNSTGGGANPPQRVSWSHQLTRKEAKRYTMKEILRGWAPKSN